MDDIKEISWDLCDISIAKEFSYKESPGNGEKCDPICRFFCHCGLQNNILCRISFCEGIEDTWKVNLRRTIY